MPSLIAVNLTGDTFFEGHPIEAVERTVATIALSDHIGLFLTAREERMRDYILAHSARTLERWRSKLWLGVSAGTQRQFEARWASLRELADAEFTFFFSFAPLLEPITLPPDLLAFGDQAWVITNGEEKTSYERARITEHRWIRDLRDQCLGSVPFFLKGMGGRYPIPLDLLSQECRQFPAVRR
jgi:protein gp37